MGSVYLAEHHVMRHRVAIKLLPQQHGRPDAPIIERFHQEARAAAKLTHPNIVRAFDVDTDDNRITYLVMEYVDGTDLQARRQPQRAAALRHGRQLHRGRPPKAWPMPTAWA